MTWVKLSDTFAEDPRLDEAGPLALALHVAGLCYCARQLTDGAIPTRALRRLIDLDDPAAVADALIAAGVWETTGSGFQIVDYLRDQPSREHVEKVRAKRAAAGRKGGRRSGESRRSSKREATPKQSAWRGLEPRPGGRSPQGRTCPTCRNPIAGDETCACPPSAGPQPAVDVTLDPPGLDLNVNAS